MSIGDNIKKKRNQKGITLLELAESIGVREATVQRYESGSIKNIKHETIIKIANVLETTPAYLMGWEEEHISKSENQPREQFINGNEKELVECYRLCNKEDKEELLIIAEHKSQKNVPAEKLNSIA